MNRRFLLNLLAYLVPTFLLGFVWHLVLFEDYYRDLAIYRENILIPFGFTAMVIQGAIFAAAYQRLAVTPGRLADAMRFVAAAALLSWTFTTLAVGAKHPMSSVPDFVLIESAFTAVQFVLVGPLLALTSR